MNTKEVQEHLECHQRWDPQWKGEGTQRRCVVRYTRQLWGKGRLMVGICLWDSSLQRVVGPTGRRCIGCCASPTCLLMKTLLCEQSLHRQHPLNSTKEMYIEKSMKWMQTDYLRWQQQSRRWKSSCLKMCQEYSTTGCVCNLPKDKTIQSKWHTPGVSHYNRIKTERRTRGVRTERVVFLDIWSTRYPDLVNLATNFQQQNLTPPALDPGRYSIQEISVVEVS